jgi:hypothetical protein
MRVSTGRRDKNRDGLSLTHKIDGEVCWQNMSVPFQRTAEICDRSGLRPACCLRGLKTAGAKLASKCNGEERFSGALGTYARIQSLGNAMLIG